MRSMALRMSTAICWILMLVQKEVPCRHLLHGHNVDKVTEKLFLPILHIYQLWELGHIAICISYFEVLVNTSSTIKGPKL
jgi:hypothetical protein